MIKMGDRMLVNSKKMLEHAKKGKYAIPHFNMNNLEWTRYILEECEALKVPVILGVSEGAVNYIGGYHTVVSMVTSLIKDLSITIPVCLHLDHGRDFYACKQAIDAGFTSVMIDASRYELAENIRITKEVCDYAQQYNVSVEAEIGHVGGSEDEMSGTIFHARLEECEEFYQKTNIDSLAPALGSVHGLYKGRPNLDFETMEQIDKALPIPLVLHGGTGIPEDQIQKAIACGIAKININTELQIAWSTEVRNFLATNDTVYDPRKIIGSGQEAVKKTIQNKVKLFQTR